MLDQRQAGAHRFGALALAPAARALHGLGLGVHGQDGVAERDGVGDGDLHQPVVGVVADDVVVRGLAADDAAEHDAAVEAGAGVVRADQVRPSRPAPAPGESPARPARRCARRCPRRVELGDRACRQLSAIFLVVGRLDDEDRARALAAGWRRRLGRIAGLRAMAPQPIRRWPTMRSPKASRPT